MEGSEELALSSWRRRLVEGGVGEREVGAIFGGGGILWCVWNWRRMVKVKGGDGACLRMSLFWQGR